MHRQRRVNDAVLWYMNDLGCRVVAASGRPEDRYHLGKLLLRALNEIPEFVIQIDGATDEEETSKSLLRRSIKCATALRNRGLGRGDVIVLMAPNHLDLAIPLNAALFLGVGVAPVDKTLQVKELQSTFSTNKPKIVFCQSERASDVQLALKQLDLAADIVTFDKGPSDVLNFEKFLEKYGDDRVEDFRPADFEPDETMAILLPTSGTTGVPKSVICSHKNFSISLTYVWFLYNEFPHPFRMALIVSPLQWLTAILHFILSGILGYTRLQSSGDLSKDNVYRIINKYKPPLTVASPTYLMELINPVDRDRCDFTCFDTIFLRGSAVTPFLIQELKKITEDAKILVAFGMSEVGAVFNFDDSVIGSCGKPLGCLQYRLIDTVTNEDIIEPNKPGELWVKGPTLFKGYYNNPEATKEAFAEDGWFMTGDMFYRDEHFNFFFVERIKQLLKYMNHQISPVELEGVISQHPGVLDVAVTGIPVDQGDLAVACVVKRPGHDVTAQEIKDLVKENLTDTKQLRGGVVFLDALPLTATTKIHRKKLKEMVLNLKPE